MAWDCFFAVAIRPDIVLPAMTRKLPSKKPESVLKFASLH